MKRNTFYLASAAVLALTLLLGETASAQTCDSTGVGRGRRTFVDANGDGYNDNAPDHDGDGIPNGKDADYARTGGGRGRGFVDADGNGINDYAQDADGDGIPNGKDADWVRPQDGSGRKMGGAFGRGRSAAGRGGFRRGGRGAGTCSGTGPVSTTGSRGRGRIR